MREIQPWDGALDAPPALHANKVFEFFYVQRKEGDMWKTLAKECFPEKYEEASNDKAEKKRLQSLWAQAVLDEVKAMRDYGKHTLRWITAVVEAQAPDHLFLRREALKHGPGSVEEKAAKRSTYVFCVRSVHVQSSRPSPLISSWEQSPPLD